MNLNGLLKYINSFIALLCLAALALVYWYAWRPLPPNSGSVPAPVSARAQVVRDHMGVPHIEAASDEDAYFLQGYVTAQDRLFQMEYARRQAAGELAAIFGAAAVESDIETRRLRMHRAAVQHARTLPPADRAVLAAYARGVNYFLETHQGKLPVEFTLLGLDPAPWTIPDTMLIGLHMFRSLTTTWKDEALKSSYMAQGEAEKVNFIFPVRTGAEPQPGSNAWVLSGRRTASGKPILANDPHLGFSLPGVWYQVHLKTPSMNVAGVSMPGAPAVIIGHNDRIAWGMTNLHFDVQDLYSERVNSAAGAFLFEGQAKTLRQEKEFVRIRGGGQREFTVASTSHGPILLTAKGQHLSIRWTATEPGLFQFPFAEINHAGNWSQFRAALSRFLGPGQNFVYADTEGNIGYQATGKLPIRRDRDGDLPADGASGKQEWDGFIPFEELPSIY
ncbi:MAG: penicillin acylase family protein, partial [Acidobacteriia bacterium]|nr:penicillin acylase family protein [Terriglobia bacterium]